MQHTYREMHSLGEVLVEDYIEEEEIRLYREQGTRTLEKEHRTTKGDRDPNTIDVDRGKGGDKMCYIYGK